MSITLHAAALSGSDSNDGLTAATPKQTLSAISTLWSSLGVAVTAIKLNGRFGRTAADSLTYSGNVAVEIVPGTHVDGTPILSGGRVLDGDDATLHAGTTYKWTIGASKNVDHVTQFWGDPTSIDANGRYKCDLTLAANLAACEATAYTYFYTGTTLYLNLNGTNPTNDAGWSMYPGEWVDGDQTDLIQIVSPNCSVSGITCENLSGTTYGVYMQGGNNLIADCTGRYIAWHHFGHVNFGGNVSGCRLERNVCHGLGMTASGTAQVFYSTGTGPTGCRANGNTIHVYNRLKVDGTPLDATVTYNGDYSHANGTTAFVEDVEWRGERIYGYENPFLAINSGDPGTVTDATRASGFPVRMVDCHVTGGYSAGGFKGCSWQRCNLIMDKLGPSSLTSVFGATAIGIQKCYMESCHVAANLGNVAGQVRSMFLLDRTDGSNYSEIRATNCNFADLSVVASWWPRICTYSGAGDFSQVTMNRCIFRGAASKGLTFNVGDSGLTQSRQSYTACLYYNWDAGYADHFSENANRNNQTDWAANVDTAAMNAVYGEDPDFSAVGTDATPDPAGYIGTTKIPAVSTALKALMGINRRRQNRRYGAWQDGNGVNHQRNFMLAES